jgi:hypothetical protein
MSDDSVRFAKLILDMGAHVQKLNLIDMDKLNAELKAWLQPRRVVQKRRGVEKP